MYSSTATYQLSLPTGILQHFRGRQRVVRDYADSYDYGNSRVDAAVRSLDYFITLATTLETISMDINDECPAIVPILDTLVNDLEYLQRNYMIVKKTK